MNNQTIFISINAAFCVIVVLCNVISSKMVAIPLLGIAIPFGVIPYPLTFILSALVTEIYGTQKAKAMVHMAFWMNLLAFGMIECALFLPAESIDNQSAFQAVLGLSGLRVFSSLFAYMISQRTEIHLYDLIKRWTSPKFLWLRNNGSTCISQLLDTIAVDLLYLYGGLGMDLAHVFPIMAVTYIYKTLFSLFCTPLFCLCVHLLRREMQLKQSYLRTYEL